MLQRSSTLRLLIPGLLLGSAASAQQFNYEVGLLPGTPRWTEGVEAVDVDQDGDLDLCFSEGEGFSGPGAQRQQVLLINQFVETGSLTFTNESVDRLGVQLAHGRGVTHGDVNGDGWVDLLYVNAFNSDTPFLFINRGAAQPGFFDMESATRGFTENLSSGGAQFGDLDDDGDLDVIICDSGNSYLGGAGDEPRLFFNDGSGNFTEDAASLNAPTKRAHMDVHLVDLDGDWTVDFVGINRATNGGGNHYVMLNNGAGTFTDASSIFDNTSGSVYEAEVGDLDGDDDVDLYFVSLSGFSEGPMENTLESGSLGFTNGTLQTNGFDDNEAALMDYDNDGDLDSFVARLGGRERLYRNNGALSFTPQNPQIEAVNDSTLDLTLGDLDNDGDYDLITAQGESIASDWVSKVYINSGPADTTRPRLAGLNVPSSSSAWPVVIKSKHADSVMDDGVDYVTATLYAAPQGPDDSAVYGGPSFGWFVGIQNITSGTRVLFNNQGPATAVSVVSGPTDFSFDLPFNVDTPYTFVVPGSYVLQESTGDTFTLNVTGTPVEVEGLRMGEGQSRFAVPMLPAVASDAFGAEIELRDYAGNSTWVNIESVDYPGGSTTSNYCGPAVLNSSGQSAVIANSGSTTVADMNFGLVASNLPVSQFGFFLISDMQGFVSAPGTSVGNLCLAGNIGRFTSQIQNSGAGGSFSIPVDLSALPTNPSQPALPGQTWNFQAWFRDTGSISNFTDGLSVTFQ